AQAVQTVQRAAEPSRAPEPSSERRRVQPSLQVSHPSDPAEREAESTARQVMSMPGPAIAARQRVSHLAARAPWPGLADDAQTSPELTSAIRTQLGGGAPLSDEV